MDKPFQAYQGDEPFVFVCYSHEDADVVYPEIGWLQEQGINVWYDEGISAGRVWRAEIAQAIDACSSVLYYVSKSSLGSAHCNREINLALDQEKTILPVYLEEAKLTDDLRIGLSRVQALHRDQDASYRQHLLNALGSTSAIDVPIPVRQRTSRANRVAVVVGISVLSIGGWWALSDKAPIEDRLQFSSIAVLPFTDASAAKNLGGLADLATRQLVTRLNELQTLNVTSVAAVEPLIQQGLPLSDIAEELGTPVVLSGYFERDGENLEIPVEIVRADDGRVLWSETLRRKGSDSGLTAKYVSGELARFLGKVSTLQDPGPTTPDAYQAWLNWHFHQANYRNWEEVKWIEQVIRLEPNYPQAHLDAFLSYYIAALDGQDERWIAEAKRALDAAREAGLEADARYLWSKGAYLTYLVGNLSEGERLLRQSQTPTYATLLADSGVTEPAIKIFESVTAQNPSFAGGWLGLGFSRGMDGDLAGALSAYEEGLRRSPDHPYLLLNHNRALIFLGQYEEAELSLERLESLEPLPPGSHLAVRGNRFWLEGKRGNRAKALEGAKLLADEGWHAMSGLLFLEFGDLQSAREQYGLAPAHPVVGRRVVSSWLHPHPAWQDHPVVRNYLNSMGFTSSWRAEICERAIDYVAQFGVELRCESL